MARLGIFVDGGYLANLAERHFRVWVDFEKLSNEIRNTIAGNTQEPLGLLRTYFYDCLPYQSNPPTSEEAQRLSRKRKEVSFPPCSGCRTTRSVRGVSCTAATTPKANPSSSKNAST